MHYTTVTVSVLLGLASAQAGQTASATPHDTYGSSIGVLGCSINTDYAMYLPKTPSCNPCTKVTYVDPSGASRSAYGLHVDTSGGAHDMAYKMFGELRTGQNVDGVDANTNNNPLRAAADMLFEFEQPAENCAHLVHGTPNARGQVGFIALSPQFQASCAETEPDSLFGKANLVNMDSACCLRGTTDCCHTEAGGSLVKCDNNAVTGIQTPLSGFAVENLLMTGQRQACLN